MTPELKNTLMGLFITNVAPFIFTAVSGLLGWMFLQLGKLFGANAAGSKKAQVIDRVFHFAQVVVAELEATVKKELPGLLADGELSAADITHLRTVALARLKALAGEQGLEELQKVLGIATPQLESYLSGIIEHAVGKLPSAVATPEPSPAAPGSTSTNPRALPSP